MVDSGWFFEETPIKSRRPYPVEEIKWKYIFSGIHFSSGIRRAMIFQPCDGTRRMSAFTVLKKIIANLPPWYYE
jgi:hypothetical protein